MSKIKKKMNLIEILVVLLILLILIVVTVPKFKQSQHFATITQVVQDFELLTKALHAYEIDHGSAPPDFDGTDVQYAKTLYKTIPTSDILSYQLLTSPVSYIKEIPIDPFLKEKRRSKGQNVFVYEYSKNLSDTIIPLKVKWNIMSIGPDLDLDNLFFHNTHLPYKQSRFYLSHRKSIREAYHSSNGIKSQGDIYASNEGIVYPY